MKRFFILAVIFLMNGALAAKVPLKTAIEKGLLRSLDYRNQVLEEKSKGLERQKARMKKYFSIDSGASYLFKSEQMEILFPGNTIKAGAKHNYDLNLSLKQPIFTGSILTQAVKAAGLQQAIAQNQVLLAKMETAAAIKSSYFNYHLLLNKKRSLDTLLRRLNLHLKRIEDFYKEELVKKTDLLETLRNIREQEIHAEELNHLIVSEKIHFEKLCGLDIDTVEAGYTEPVDGYREAFKEFKRSHPLLKTLENRLAVLSTQRNMVKGEYLPQIAGFAELHYGRPGLDFFKNQWQFYFQGGVQVGFKLFDWNKKKRDLTVLDYAAEKVKNQRENFILEVEKSLKQLFEAGKSIQKRIDILNDLSRIAEEDAQLKAGLYKEQQISNIDYLDALTTKERYEYMKNELKMQYQLIKVNINLLVKEE